MKLVIFCVLCVLPAYPQQPATQEHQYPGLPAGAGRDTLVQVCSKCHSPENVIANGQTRAGWEDTITKMAGFGAVATDDQFTEILNYLEKNFPPGSTGPINVNQATATQLETGLGLTNKEADAVIDYRKKNGAYQSIDDLKKVPGVDAKKFEAKKDRLAY